jgi:Flp pilus assembly pilin Flp
MLDSEGATAIEYGLIASLIAFAVVGSLSVLKAAVMGNFLWTATALTMGQGSPTSPEFLEMVWGYVHGGDEEVTIQEYIDLCSGTFGDSEQVVTQDFEWADQDDSDYLDHNEWVYNQGGPPPT